MDQLGDDDQVSITIENQEIFLSSDSEVESPNLTSNYNFRSEENLKFLI